MTYDQAFHKLQSLFKNGEYNGWELTDPDSLQAFKSVDGVFHFVEFGESFTETTAILLHAAYRFSDYSLDDLWEHGKFYFQGYQEFLDMPAYVKFECMFESENGKPLPVNEAYENYLAILNQ